MSTFRSFKPEIEQIAKEWRNTVVTTDAWLVQHIVHQYSEAQAMFVRNGAISGYGKPGRNQPPVSQHCRAAHEKIASDLAFELGLPIPPTILWDRTPHPPGCERYCSISVVPFTNPNSWRQIAVQTPLVNRLLKAIAPVASAMAAFDTWIGNLDRANAGNLLVTEDVSENPAIVRVAYIDYANSLSHGWPDDLQGATVRPVRHYPNGIICDEKLLDEVLAGIEALGDNVIKEIISRVPAVFIPDEKRRIIETALIGRKSKLRLALRTVYPNLPSVKPTHSAFSRIRYLVDPAQPTSLVIPLGVAVEVVIGDQWMIGLCARTALSPDETALLDGIGRELLRNPFEALKREMSTLIQNIEKPGDALNILASTNIWSLNVTAAAKWGASFQSNTAIESQIREKMAVLWKEVLQELLMLPATPRAKTKAHSSRPARRRLSMPSLAVPAGRSFVQDNCWRGVVPRRAA